MITTNTEIRVIKLSCVSCGSVLDISQQMDRLACGYCGTQQIVERSGGAIHLRGVAEALSKVQVGTDRTASELAIVRLTKELEGLHYHRAEKEQNWFNFRNQKLSEWDVAIRAKKRPVNFVTGGTVFICMALFQLDKFMNSSFLVLICFIVLIAAPILVRKAMKKSDKYSPSKLQDECNKELAILDRQIAKDLGETDKLIATHNARIQQNYQIANS